MIRSDNSDLRRTIIFPLVVVSLAPLVLSGCRGDRLEALVAGKITLDGQPIGPGIATFVPVDGSRNPGIGDINPDGSYAVRTSRTQGMLAGEYKVAVQVYQQPNLKPGERAMTRPNLVHPDKYASPDTSGLKYTVERGRNTINIELQRKSGAT